MDSRLSQRSYTRGETPSVSSSKHAGMFSQRANRFTLRVKTSLTSSFPCFAGIFMAPLPVFLLLLAFLFCKVAIVFSSFLKPVSVCTFLTVIPDVIVLVFAIVVPVFPIVTVPIFMPLLQTATGPKWACRKHWR
jgi:hypothetical protein